MKKTLKLIVLLMALAQVTVAATKLTFTQVTENTAGQPMQMDHYSAHCGLTITNLNLSVTSTAPVSEFMLEGLLPDYQEYVCVVVAWGYDASGQMQNSAYSNIVVTKKNVPPDLQVPVAVNDLSAV